MPKRRTENEADSRERILHAATEVFATIGYGAARVDDIAARANVNKALLYYHVGGKEELYAAVLTTATDRARAALEEALAAADTPSARVQAVLDTLARLGSTSPVFIPMVLREIASGGAALPDAMLLRMSEVFRLVAGVLQEGMDSGVFRKVDPLLTHVTVVGATMFLVASGPVRRRLSAITGMPFTEHSPEQLAAHIGNILIHGLESREAAPKRAAAKRRRS